MLALACVVITMDVTVLLLAVPSLASDLVTDTYGFLTTGDRFGRRRLLRVHPSR